jgi:hypothetical protein
MIYSKNLVKFTNFNSQKKYKQNSLELKRRWYIGSK